jgi:CDP-diacylglycerol--glycerol-3-phosphate 3-phosphatidyltransferase
MEELLLSNNMTISNKITFFRILLAPLVFVMLVNRDIFSANIEDNILNYITGLLFAIASISDFFDGYIARKLNQTSLIGSILDPIADKVLILSAMLGLLYLGKIDVWAVMIILSREFIVTGIRMAVAHQKSNVSASLMGKIKTVLQIIAILFLILNWPYAQFLLWLAVFATIYSGVEYIIIYYKILKVK